MWQTHQHVGFGAGKRLTRAVNLGFGSWWKCESMKSGGCLSKHAGNNFLWLATNDVAAAAAALTRTARMSYPQAVLLGALWTYSWVADEEKDNTWYALTGTQDFPPFLYGISLLASWPAAMFKMYSLTVPICSPLISTENTEKKKVSFALVCGLCGYPLHF